METLEAYRAWCQKEQVSADKCIVVEGVSKEGYSSCTVINHLKGFGNVKVISERESGDYFSIRCIFQAPVQDLPIPSTIAVAEGIKWKLVYLEVPPAKDDAHTPPNTPPNTAKDNTPPAPPVDFEAMLKDFLLETEARKGQQRTNQSRNNI